jgi:hypothetical protein
VTPLSGSGSGRGVDSAKGGLARRWLLPVVALVLPGCLDATPEYSVPERIPPVIITSQLDPAPGVITNIGNVDSVPFHASFRSVDAGEDLDAKFVFDIETLDCDQGSEPDCFAIVFEEHIPAKAESFSEQATSPHEVGFTWVVRDRDRTENPNPHTMTMFVTHSSNFTSGWPVIDPLETAEVTWFFNLAAPADEAAAQ